jgi:hypothetical protein
MMNEPELLQQREWLRRRKSWGGCSCQYPVFFIGNHAGSGRSDCLWDCCKICDAVLMPGRTRKGYLKNQAPYSIIYSESESDTSSDLPSVKNVKKDSILLSQGRDAISFCYDCLCKTEPQKLLTKE